MLPSSQVAPCGICLSPSHRQTCQGPSPWPSCLRRQRIVLAVWRNVQNPWANIWTERAIWGQADSVQAREAERWPLFGVLSRDTSKRNLDLFPVLWLLLEYVHLFTCTVDAWSHHCLKKQFCMARWWQVILFINSKIKSRSLNCAFTLHHMQNTSESKWAQSRNVQIRIPNALALADS